MELEEIINSGIAPPPYRPAETESQKDDAAYAALIKSGETDEPAANLFQNIETEISNYGYSTLVDEAKQKWEVEQNSDAEQSITNLLEDPSINIEFKKSQLQKYLNNSISFSTDIKDKWKQDLNNNYIIDNNLQNSDAFAEADNQISNLNTEQALEDLKESIKAKDAGELATPPDYDTFQTRFNRLLDIWKEFGSYNLNPLDKTVEDPGYIPGADDLAFLTSMMYHMPDYFSELLSTWSLGSGHTNQRALLGAAFAEATGLNKILPTLSVKEASNQLLENRKKTWTQIREEVQVQRKTALTKEVAEGLDFLLKTLGMDVKAPSVVKMPFDVLGEAIDAIAKSNDDPGKTALMLETVLVFALPWAANKVRSMKQGQSKKKNQLITKEQAYQEFDIFRAWRDKNAPTREPNVIYASDGTVSVPTVSLPTSTVTSDGKVVPINYKPTGRVRPNGNPVKAQFNKETLDITVDSELIIKTFPKVPAKSFIVDGIVTWRNPAIATQQKDIEDFQASGEFEIVINTPEEYVQFIVEHEVAHVTNPQLPGESKATYEGRINELSYRIFNANRYKDIQKEMPPAGNPKVNTPLATTNISNPKAGIEMWTEILRNPDTLPIVGLTPEQLLLKMYDPVDNVYKSNNIGPVPDATMLAQIIRAKKAEDLMALIDSSDPHAFLKRKYIFNTLELNNRIIKDYEVIQASSLDILQSTGTGFNFGVAYRKSVTENFKNPKEAMIIYETIKNQILSTRQAKELLPTQSLELHEVLDRDGSFQPIEVYKDGIVPEERLNLDTTSSFIIRWNERTSFTDFFEQELTRTPEELYSNSLVGGFTPKLLTKVFPGSNKGGIEGPVAYWRMSIGRFPEAVETHYRQSMLRVQQYGDQQRQIMLKNVVLRLGKVDQVMLEKVLYAARKLQMDYPTIDLLKDVLPPMKHDRLLRIQRAAHNYRFFLQSMYRFQSSEAYNVLFRAGYDQQFIIKDPKTGVNQVLPVMESFIIEEGPGIVPSPDGTMYSTQVYHTDYQKMVLVQLNKKHMFETNKVFNFENNMPKEQIFRSNHLIEDPTNSNIKSDYIMSNQFKAMPLQTNVIPYVQGHIPRINTDSRVIEAIPLKVERNGHVSNFMDAKGNHPYLGTLKNDLLDLTQQNQSLETRADKSEFITSHEEYARVVATFETLKGAQDFTDFQINTMKQMYPDHVFVVRLGRDLQANTLRQHYEAEANNAMSKSLRGNLLHWETADGPLKSALIQSHTTGKKYLNDLSVTRMQEMFIKLYVEPGSQSVVAITANPKVTGRPDSSNRFPVSRDQIGKKGDLQAEHTQALALFDQIQELNIGLPNRALADLVFNSAKSIADKIENDPGFLKRLNTDPLIKALRKTQRGAKEVEGALDRSITFLKIRLNPIGMILVQSPAALANLFVYGQDGLLYNPIKVAENFKDTARLFAMAMRLGFKEKLTDKAVWDTLDSLLENGELPRLPENGKGFFGYKEKLATQDLMLILLKAKETGFFDVGNHEMMSSLFSNKMIELGEGQTSWNTSPEGIKDLTYRLVNPSNLIKRATKISGDFFTYSEAFSRLPQVIVSLRNWQTKNPGANWRTDKGIQEIFMDADKLAGSMHQYARFNYSKSTFTQWFAKFVLYVDKQREMLTNERARIGTAKEAWSAMALWAPLTGAMAFGLYDQLMNGLEYLYENLFDADDEEKAMKTWHQFAMIDLALEYMMTGEMNEGDRLIIGEKISPYGSKEMAWGFMGQVYNLAVSLVTGDFKDNPNKGIFLSMMEQIFGPRGTMPTLISLYTNPMIDTGDKAEVALKLVTRYIPFVKNLDTTEQQLLLNDLSTRTGHTLGIGGTKTDIFIRGLLGLQTKDTKELWKIVEDDMKRMKLYKELAKISVETFFIANQRAVTQEDLLEHTQGWIALLKAQGVVKDTQNALEFIAEFESIINRQDKSLLNTLADKEIADMVMQEHYDPSTVEKLLRLSEIQQNKGDYIKAEQTKNRANEMMKINKEYNEQQQGNK